MVQLSTTGAISNPHLIMEAIDREETMELMRNNQPIGRVIPEPLVDQIRSILTTYHIATKSVLSPEKRQELDYLIWELSMPPIS